MLYLGIDQHARQITISLRDENGDVLQARQVSTQPEKINTFFQQLTDDSGPGAKLGGFRGRAIGIGPQIGFIIPLSEGYQGYLNVRGYKDLEVENRAKTWTAWVTFSVSPAAPEPAPAKPIVRKY